MFGTHISNVKKCAAEPTVTISPKTTSQHVGSTIRLSCAVTGHPKPTVKWTRENGQLPEQHMRDNGLLMYVIASEI